jgi:hypothetical protein
MEKTKEELEKCVKQCKRYAHVTRITLLRQLLKDGIKEEIAGMYLYNILMAMLMDLLWDVVDESRDAIVKSTIGHIEEGIKLLEEMKRLEKELNLAQT